MKVITNFPRSCRTTQQIRKPGLVSVRKFQAASSLFTRTSWFENFL